MRTKSMRPVVVAEAPVSPRVAACRAIVDAYKRDGVDPFVLAEAVEDLREALAEAPEAPVVNIPAADPAPATDI
jgi:hypothetical protein